MYTNQQPSIYSQQNTSRTNSTQDITNIAEIGFLIGIAFATIILIITIINTVRAWMVQTATFQIRDDLHEIKEMVATQQVDRTNTYSQEEANTVPLEQEQSPPNKESTVIQKPTFSKPFLFTILGVATLFAVTLGLISTM